MGHISILLFLCFLFAVLRSTLRIFDFVLRLGFPLFPIPLQLGIRVRYRFYELLLAIINPLGRFIEFKLVRCYRSLSTLPLDNSLSLCFTPPTPLYLNRNYIITTSLMCGLLSHLDFFCGWHPLLITPMSFCAIPRQRERVAGTGLEPV